MSEKMPQWTPEDLKNQAERVKSDSTLIAQGAEYDMPENSTEPRLQVEAEQINAAKYLENDNQRFTSIGDKREYVDKAIRRELYAVLMEKFTPKFEELLKNSKLDEGLIKALESHFEPGMPKEAEADSFIYISSLNKKIRLDTYPGIIVPELEDEEGKTVKWVDLGLDVKKELTDTIVEKFLEKAKQAIEHYETV